MHRNFVTSILMAFIKKLKLKSLNYKVKYYLIYLELKKYLLTHSVIN